MSSGIPYDSDHGRAICGALSSILTGRAYATSAEIAAKSGAFPGHKANAQAMLRVIRNHKRAADGEAAGYEKLSVAPTPLDHAELANAGPAWAELSEAARASWRDALTLGETHGYRNAQVSVIAPTGTIGLVMDCDTTGIEPDFALVKFKKLAGGGYFKIINRAVPEALRTLGYDEKQIGDIVAYAVGRATLAHAPGVNHAALKAKGLPQERSTRSRRRSAAPSTSASSSTNGRSASRPWPGAQDHARALRRAGLRSSDRARLLEGRDRGRQLLRLRRDDARRRALSQGRASLGVRLRQPLRAHGQALSLGREPHPHDGGGAAVHHRRDLEDHQHAQRRVRRGLQGRLHAVLAPRPQGERALSRRLETVAAARTRN